MVKIQPHFRQWWSSLSLAGNYKLRALPADAKIKLMLLSVGDLQQYVNKTKSTSNNILIDLLLKTWYFKETGDEVSLFFIDGTEYTRDELLKRCRSKRTYQLVDLEKFINFFTEQSEVYSK